MLSWLSTCTAPSTFSDGGSPASALPPLPEPDPPPCPSGANSQMAAPANAASIRIEIERVEYVAELRAIVLRSLRAFPSAVHQVERAKSRTRYPRQGRVSEQIPGCWLVRGPGEYAD